MKKLIATFLLLPTLAWGAVNDVFVNQRNGDDSGTLSRTVTIPPNGADGLLGFNGSTVRPQFYTLGAGLSLSGGVLTVTAPTPNWAAITGKPTFATVATSGAYADLSGRPTIPAAQVAPDWLASSGVAAILNKPTSFPPAAHTQAWSTITATPTTLAGYGISDALARPSGTAGQYLRGDGSLGTFPTALSAFSNDPGYLTSISSAQVASALGFTPLTQAGARSAISLSTTGTGAASYNSSTGVLNVPTPATSTRTFTNPTRTLNSAFQISATRDAAVIYTVDISVTSLLIAGASGRVYLEYADDAAMSTNLVVVNSAPNATGGVLNVTNLGPGNVSGWIPAGKYVRIRTANVTNAPTFTFQSSQEVLQ